MNNNFVDLVVAGPDFSGTTTQIDDFIKYFLSKNMVVRNMCGNETDALFHAQKFSDINKGYVCLRDFLDDPKTSIESKLNVLEQSYNLLEGRNLSVKGDLFVGSMMKTDHTTYIDPNSADVWIFEEPTKRGSGQECRTFEQNASKFGDKLNGARAAQAHQEYRTTEFFRFRKPLREAGKIIIRSRSEESASYQIYDELSFHSGLSIDDYLKLPGHHVAFANPPTHIFVVCGPENWEKDAYLKLKSERTGKRILDDHESNYSYQLLVNQRYASDWLENLYKKGCAMYGSKEPMIVRFDIYKSIEETRELMGQALQGVLLGRFLDTLSGNIKK